MGTHVPPTRDLIKSLAKPFIFHHCILGTSQVKCVVLCVVPFLLITSCVAKKPKLMLNRCKITQCAVCNPSWKSCVLTLIIIVGKHIGTSELCQKSPLGLLIYVPQDCPAPFLDRYFPTANFSGTFARVRPALSESSFG